MPLPNPILPKLDPKPTGKPMDWNFKKIQLLKEKKPPEITRPQQWRNPNVTFLAPRDQADRGTCVGQSTAYCFDLLHAMLRPDDRPTADDIAAYKKDVVDSIGTTHDVLYKDSASAEAFYQMSRKIGNITYPSGSETRYAARAWIDWGMVTETMWHTDKLGTKVWMHEPRQTPDGGVTMAEATEFAKLHRAEGWAMVGDDAGNATFDEICDAIYTKGFVLAGIPIYENYGEMQGGNGAIPEARGEIAGYHALCFYGYDENTIYLLHSWGDWCAMKGSVSKEYINGHKYESVYLVVLDSSDVVIARENFSSMTVNVKDRATGKVLAAQVFVDGKLIGLSPQKFTTVPGMRYTIEVKCDGYRSQKKSADGSEITFELDADNVPDQSMWWKRIIDWIIALFKR